MFDAVGGPRGNGVCKRESSGSDLCGLVFCVLHSTTVCMTIAFAVPYASIQ